MSLCRFSNESDLYIFGGPDGVECYCNRSGKHGSKMECMDGGFFFVPYDDVDECSLSKDGVKCLISHVQEHIDAGHKVLPHVIPSIRREFLWPAWLYRLYCRLMFYKNRFTKRQDDE